jgi:hypothetical protein
MHKNAVLVVLTCAVTACGTYTLGNVRPQVGKTAEQQQLDTLTCKDQANLAANTAGRQTGDFLLGLTIIGTPVAIEREKAKEREVFADCMTARGYVVTPADGSNPPVRSAAASSPPATPARTTVPGVDQLALTLPDGFAMKPVPENLKAIGAVLYAVDRTLDIAMLVIPVGHEGITDFNAYALTKRANQADRLKDASTSELTHLDVGGRNAIRYSATGIYNNVKVTFVTTIIEGREQFVLITAWTGATNALQQMPLLESLGGTVSGIL